MRFPKVGAGLALAVLAAAILPAATPEAVEPGEAPDHREQVGRAMALLEQARRLADPPIVPLDASPLALLPSEPEVARLLSENLPPPVASGIAQIRAIQLTGDAPARIEDIMALVGSLAVATSLHRDQLPSADVCPAVPGGSPGAPASGVAGGTHVGGGYGNAAVCVLGTASGSYSCSTYCYGATGGLMIDLGGDDSYSANGYSFGQTNGIFIDLDGDDHTVAAFTNSHAGLDSVFIDYRGDDHHSSGGGAFGQIGSVFVDAAGDDHYEATLQSSFATIGGRFFDLEGDDHYQGSVRNSPTASQSSFGLAGGGMVDLEGDDVYEARSHNSFAYSGDFIDAEGNDQYIAPDTSFGYGSGTFLDLEGDDHYSSEHTSFGLLGGVFVDVDGDDVYDSGDSTIGRGGVFLDIAGDDDYGGGWRSDMTNGVFEIPTIAADLADPAGRGAGNGQIEVIEERQGSPADAPGTTNDADDQVDAEWAGLWAVDMRLEPEVVRPGATVDFDVTLGAPLPVHLQILDDQGNVLDLSPGGLHANAPGVFWSSIEDSIVAAYTAPTQGPRTFIVTVHDMLQERSMEEFEFGPLAIDGTSPSISSAFDDGAGSLDDFAWHSEATPTAGLTLRASDMQSGIHELYVLDGVAPDPASHAPVRSFPVGADGRGEPGIVEWLVPMSSMQEGHRIYHVLAIDGVGNERRITRDAYIDRTAPEWQIDLINGTLGAQGWWLEAPEVWLNISDGLSGIGALNATWSGATIDQTTSVHARQRVDPGLAQGESTLALEAEDKAHSPNVRSNASALHVRVDGTPPVITSHVPAEDALAPASISWSAHDAHSGVNASLARVWRDGATPPSWGPADGMQVGHGTWHYEAYAVDRAGNVGAVDAGTFTVASPPPVPDFSYTPSEPDSTTHVRFQDLSTDPDGVIEAWHWDFGDGNTSSVPAPQHRFGRPGTFTVTLNVTDDAGLQRDVSRQVAVANVPPTASLAGPTVLSPGQPGTYVVEISDPDDVLHTVTWHTGDQGTTLDVSFDEEGSHPVQATVEDSHGATATAQLVVVVRNLAPLAIIQAPAQAGLGQDIAFIDGSLDEDGSIALWQWDFGDGNTSLEQAPTHAYQAAGTYVVQLRVEDDRGASATASHTLVITSDPPVAGFTVERDDDLTGTEIHFIDHSTDDEGIQGWLWDFGDGGAASVAEPTHAYADDGTYTVTLVVVDAEGATGTHQETVVVNNRPPIAAFTHTSAIAGSPVDFTDASSDPDGQIVAWNWRFTAQDTGDGNAVTHTFAAPGTYTVSLTVEDDDGATHEATQQLQVAGRPPVAAFTAPAPAPSGTSLSFEDASLDADDDIVSWDWDFGDGQVGAGAQVTHAYPTPGTYTVRLTVTDAEGLTDDVEATVVVANREPTVAITSTGTTAGEPVRFEAAAADPDGDVVAWSWDFGAGPANQTAVAWHTFDAGQHTVRVTVTDALGGQGSAQITLTIVAAADNSEEQTQDDGDTGSGDTGSGDTGSGDTGSGDTGSGETGTDGDAEPTQEETDEGKEAPSPILLLPLAIALWLRRRRA